MRKITNNTSIIDLFCGVGGLSYGLQQAGFKINAGIDIDNSCSFAYTENVKSDFIHADITKIEGSTLIEKYWNNQDTRILVGCAPCQPFSSAANTLKEKDDIKWNLLKQFQRLISEINPEIISMENVPNLLKKDIFQDFLNFLEKNNYFTTYQIIYCPDYGIPQKRRRLVLLASKLGKIDFIKKTHTKENYKTVADTIGKMEKIDAGINISQDPLHKSIKLSEKNLKRIQSSLPGGTWRDWPEDLRLECHKKDSGKTYSSVYGRMKWNEPSPTITTQFYNYGTGRFGHPVQNRALSLREGALLQTFPKDYKFYSHPNQVSLDTIGRHIGNAVPVDLGKIIGQSIKKHLSSFSHK